VAFESLSIAHSGRLVQPIHLKHEHERMSAQAQSLPTQSVLIVALLLRYFRHLSLRGPGVAHCPDGTCCTLAVRKITLTWVRATVTPGQYRSMLLPRAMVLAWKL
jgi:hypothetical protein